MLQLDVQRRRALALVDSGASHNFVGASFARSLGVSFQRGKTLRVQLADGKLVLSQQIIRVPVLFGSVTMSVTFHVLDTPVDVVLGMQWLRQSNPTIHWATGAVSLVHRGQRCMVPSVFHSHVGKAHAALLDSIHTQQSSGPPADHSPTLPVHTHQISGPPADHSPTVIGLQQFAREAVRGEYGQMFCATLLDTEFDATAYHAIETNGESVLTEMQREFPKVFGEPEYPIRTRNIEHQIHLRDDSVPPARKLYPLSTDELQELKAQIDKFLADGRIVPSASPYGAPILFASKKDGGLRMCVDYRSLNAQTIPDSFPIPRIDELLARLQGARVFSKLDLRDGYHQVAVASDDQAKTAFNCRYGSFEWRVMPFGLRNAPSTFQRLMHHVFHDLLDVCVVVYLDDILIYSPDEESHREHVRRVFACLQQHDLHVKASKCQLYADSLSFLGHIVSSSGVSVDPMKVQAVQDWPQPSCRRDVQVFLGLCNYYRRFVSGFGSIARPLTQLTRKDVAFAWDAPQQAAFDTLRTALVSAPVLQLFDRTRQTRVVCDASDFAVGAVLEQYDETDGGWHPVEYLSKSLSGAEANYSATEREFLALVLSLRQWRHYLVGHQFTVLTDHAALRYLQSQARLSRRQARWLELFADFEFTIEHVAGVANRTDPLSRRPDLVAAVAVGIDDDLLTRVQQAQADASDEDFVAFRKAAEQTDSEFEFVDGLLCHVGSTRRRQCRVVIPDCGLRTELIRLHHETPLSGHLGTYRVIGSLSQRYYWRTLQRDVRTFIRGCQTCQATKVPTRAPQGLLQPLPPADRPWQSVTMDLVTDLPATSRGHTAIATFVDRFSKMVHFRPCTSSVTAVDLASIFLECVVCRYGCPEHVVSDRDPRFVSHFWSAVMRLLDVRQSLTTAYHPESDGQSERMHRTVEQVLRCYVSPLQSDWDIYLPCAEFAMNSTRSSATQHSPFEVVFGRQPTQPFEQSIARLTDCKVESSRSYVEHLSEITASVRAQLTRAADSMSRSANRKRREHDIVVGDQVWLHTANIRLPTRVSRKLAPKYVGPFRVLDAVGPVAFRVALPSEYRIHDVFHVSMLKKHVAGLPEQSSAPPAPVEYTQGLEYEVEDILDVRVVRRGRGQRREFLIKWRGYSLFDSTWEPESHLTHCSELLSSFLTRRGL